MGHAENNKVQHVVSINLRIGDMLGLTEECIQWYFDYLSQGTIAEGGKILFSKSRVIIQCQSCRHTATLDGRQTDTKTCPACGSTRGVLLSGREFVIENIGVIS